jgi:hypothetical protein
MTPDKKGNSEKTSTAAMLRKQIARASDFFKSVIA